MLVSGIAQSWLLAACLQGTLVHTVFHYFERKRENIFFAILKTCRFFLQK